MVYKITDLHSKPRKMKIDSFMQWIKVGRICSNISGVEAGLFKAMSPIRNRIIHKKWSQTKSNPFANQLFPGKKNASKVERGEINNQRIKGGRATGLHIWIMGISFPIQ